MAEEDEELLALRAEVERLKSELADELAKPPPEPEDNSDLLKLWDSFPFGDTGQGMQPGSRNKNGALTAIWRAYFEHTMPGGLKSAALLRFANRTDVELAYTYPNMKNNWQQKLFEVSLVIHSVTYDTIKMELSDAQGRNIVSMGYFQYDTKLGFPHFPYRVQQQEVLYHGSTYGPNMTVEAMKNTIAPQAEFDEKGAQRVANSVSEKPAHIASLKSAYICCEDLGDIDSPHKKIPEERTDDYNEVIAPYRKYHSGEGLEGEDFPTAKNAKNGILLHLYPKQSEVVKFKPNRLYRGAQYIGWWFGQVHGSKFQGAVSHCMITDLLPWVQQAQPNNPFENIDFCGIFLQCRGWLQPHSMVEVILFSDETNRNQLFILCNPGQDTPAIVGFVKYKPRHGELYRHEVLLATQGVEFLVAYARGKGSAKTSKEVAAAIDFTNTQRH